MKGWRIRAHLASLLTLSASNIQNIQRVGPLHPEHTVSFQTLRAPVYLMQSCLYNKMNENPTRRLPSIPRGFLHPDSFQLPDQLLAAPPDGLPEFGEGAAALQAVLSGAPVLRAGPAGTAVPWRTEDRRGSEPNRRQEVPPRWFLPSTEPNSLS